jgi:hypothetical protein
MKYERQSGVRLVVLVPLACNMQEVSIFGNVNASLTKLGGSHATIHDNIHRMIARKA